LREQLGKGSLAASHIEGGAPNMIGEGRLAMDRAQVEEDIDRQKVMRV
jgi:hypothetical protein